MFLKYHPTIWMRDDAAMALNALEDKYGPIVINRGGVSEAVQQSLIDRWDRGGPANRPPYLFEPKRPARASTHVEGTGLDVRNYTSDRAKLNEFGYEWYGPSDYVHYTFRGWTPPHSEEEDMGNIDDNEHNQVVIGKAIQRALRYDVRPNGYGATWELGPTLWERLNQIEGAAKTGSKLNADDVAGFVDALADAIPDDIAEQVVNALANRLKENG